MEALYHLREREWEDIEYIKFNKKDLSHEHRYY